MLARRRGFGREGTTIIETPLLVPSFSSKGFPEAQSIIEATEPVMNSSILISAYDLHHGLVEANVEFAESIILDSGGYESGLDLDLSEAAGRSHSPLSWSRGQYLATTSSWKSSRPTVIVSFDHHLDRVAITDQIARAREDIPVGPTRFSELLLKPEAKGIPYLDTSLIASVAEELVTFDAIGVTEKEIGDTMLSRMLNIAKIRVAVDRAGGESTPIHVFGSLDTVSTPLYQIAGADVFDGLTWLRYAFTGGQTVYRQNYAAAYLGLDVAPDVMAVQTWVNNYLYLQDMQLRMRAFADTGDVRNFRYNQELFCGALEALKANVGD